MIISFLLQLVYLFIALITSPLRLFGDVSMPSFLSTTISTANGYLSYGNAWLPHTVTTILLTWGIYLAIEVAIFTYKGFMWVIRRIPGQG